MGTSAALHDLLSSARMTGTDINEHLNTLMAMAASCDQIVEFGVNQGSSTVAFLSGGRGKLDSWDIERTPKVDQIAEVAGDRWTFHLGDSGACDIPECDLLFIDSLHTAAHLSKELVRHAAKVKAHIVLHDTEVNGERGIDGGPGLRVALVDFLLANTDWQIENHYVNNHGLTILRRVA